MKLKVAIPGVVTGLVVAGLAIAGPATAAEQSDGVSDIGSNKTVLLNVSDGTVIHEAPGAMPGFDSATMEQRQAWILAH